jgi:conjugal transfer/type IV secretion protein DotA/TraY
MFDLLKKPDADSVDIAYGWIVELFPTAVNSPYAQAFATFSGMLTFLGSLFLAYHVLQGIVLSAYTGKVLGERFHQIWAPLRVVLGMGLLVPISGGFSSIHYLLRDVVGVAAVNMGNAPITAYIKAVTEPNAAKSVDIAAMKGRFVFNDFLDKEVCHAVHQGLSSGTWSSFFGVAGTVTAPEKGQIDGMLSLSSGYKYDYGDCGSLRFTVPNVKDVGTGILAGIGPEYDKFAKIRANATDEMMLNIRNRVNPDGRLGDYFRTHDVKEMKGPELLKALRTEGVVPADLARFAEDQAKQWNAKVSAASADVYKFVMDKNGKALNEKIEKHGFMAAGGFERALTKASSIGVSLANASPEKRPPTLDQAYAGPYRAALSAVLGIPTLGDENNGGDAILSTNSGEEPINTFIAAISPSIASMKAGAGSVSGDPLGDMIAFGHNLLATYESLMLVVVGVKTLAHMAAALADGSTATVGNALTGGYGAMLAKGATAAAAEALDYIISWFHPVMSTLLIVGILHSFVLPMLPMMMVFVMGVSWLIMFLEASIAAVLWAFVFIRMDGQDFVDQGQKPGVGLLFNLFLRPAIGMLAFVGGLLLLPKLMNSLSILWDDSFNSQTSPDMLWIIQWIVGLVLYTWMQWHLALRLFGLIPTIADRVGSWMGLNTHGYNDGQETTAAIGAAVAAGQVGRTLQRRPKGPKGNPEMAGLKEEAARQSILLGQIAQQTAAKGS